MNKQTLQSIVDNAPMSATHVDCNGISTTYIWCGTQRSSWWDGESWNDLRHMMKNTRSLSDIKTILAQQEEIERLKTEEMKSDLRVMINARRLIKANKRTSNGRLASELWGMGMGSGRDYCRKLGLDPDSNETPYDTEIKGAKE